MSGKETLEDMNPFIAIIILLSILGTLFNLWLLIIMLTSRDIRSSLRNKIICNTLVVHVLNSGIIFPAKVVLIVNEFDVRCVIYSLVENLRLVQNFTANWLVVMLLVVFIAQIKDFNPRTRLTPKTITLGTIGLLALPWFASLIVISILVLNNKPWTNMYCFSLSIYMHQLMEFFDTFLPIVLSILLLIIAAVLKYRRFTPRENYGSIGAELISSGPEIDNTFAYVAAVAVCILCDLLQFLQLFNIRIFDTTDSFIWFQVSEIMSDARVILMPLTWLLLPYGMQAIRTLGPRTSSAPDNDFIQLTTKQEI